MNLDIMNLDIDIIIFIGFLAITLAVGLFYGRNVTTVKDYALGGRNFSTATLATTLIATWISGSAFLTDVSETYTGGLFYMVPGMLGDIFSWIIICYFIAPRMGEFLGSLSIADALGNLYGNKVRFIAAISGTFNCIGKVAAQFKVSSTILQLFFGLSSFYATLLSSIIIVIYSAFGGIRAVTFTDIIQFATFGSIVPIIALIIWGGFDDPQVVFYTLSENPLFDYTQLFNSNHPAFWGTITLALYFIIPSFNPAIFQRVSMAKNTMQISNSFFLATFARLIISILFFWVGILLLAQDPSLEPTRLFAYIIDKYIYIGFKGFVAAGVMAMVMSTADSYINAATITLSYDIRKAFGIDYWSEKRSLIFTYICAVFIGILAFVLAFYMKGLLQLFLLVSSFYLPVVTVPFLLAIFGFRTSSTSVLAGIASGLIVVLLWRIYVMDITGIDSVIPGMITNIIFLFGTHYLLAQPGGWIGIKDYSDLYKLRQTRKDKVLMLIKTIKNFNFFVFCQKNTPKQESTYTFFGIFCIVFVFSTMYSMPTDLRTQYSELIKVIYHSVLIMSSIFLTYPIWPITFRNKNFISIFWMLGLFYILVFVGGLQIIISNFGQFQLMIFLLGAVVLSILVHWQTALFLMITGMFFSVQFFKWYVGVSNLPGNLGDIQFKIIYALLLLSSILIAFLKPKQEQFEATEEKAAHLEYEVKDLKKEADFAKRELENVVQGLDFLENQFKDKEGKLKSKEIYLKDQLKLRNIEISKLRDLKDEFIRNIPHETNTPMTGILSLSEVLYSCYDSLDEKLVKQSIKDIVSSSDRLKSFVSNIADLSKLSALTYELDKTEVDLSELARERTVLYKKIFADDDRQEFIFKVEDKLIVQCDEYYITQAIDNLISNSVKYGEGKPITISLTKTEDNNVQFSITDEGIGIPKDELISIFSKFTTSSKTQTPAGGRGVGLALCEKVITVHGGTIEAKSDGKKGSRFSFVLPL